MHTHVTWIGLEIVVAFLVLGLESAKVMWVRYVPNVLGGTFSQLFPENHVECNFHWFLKFSVLWELESGYLSSLDELNVMEATGGRSYCRKETISAYLDSRAVIQVFLQSS